MLFLTVIKGIANFLYLFLKRLPTRKNKVLFLSRQFNHLSLDYQLLISELKRSNVPVEIVSVLCRLEKSPKGVVKFFLSQLISMYHLATAKVCVLDSYWPAVSILKHKDELTVIQMWHAAGKIKKSGYQTLGMPYGRNRKISELMNMHCGYDVIIAGGEKLNPFYCESFNTTEEKLFHVGLPRIDWLLEKRSTGLEYLLERHPEYRGKKIILYAPTFRKGQKLDCEQLCQAFNVNGYALIVKPHQRQTLEQGVDADLCRDFSTMSLLAACDYLITDYSAIVFEAAAIRKKTVFYLYDYEQYLHNNGLNIDVAREMPECTYFTVEDTVHAIMEDQYCFEALDNFAAQYLPQCLGNSTEKIAKLIIDCIERGKDEGISRSLGRESETAVPVV